MHPEILLVRCDSGKRAKKGFRIVQQDVQPALDRLLLAYCDCIFFFRILDSGATAARPCSTQWK